MQPDTYLEGFCQEILAKDQSIRFAGIADHLGHLIASAYRKGLIPLMDKDETEKYTVQTVIRAAMRETFDSKIGGLRYAVGTYQKLIRSTIPIAYSRHKFYLLLSFDVGSDANFTIENKVLPFVAKNKDYFL